MLTMLDSIVNIMRGGGEVDDHLTRAKVFTLIMKNIFI